MRAVAVYSEADHTAPHVALADAAHCLGPAPAQHSYLNAERILEVAALERVDAVHPGYGFLSENAHFARQCAARGFTFVGPGPDVIEAMGRKVDARRFAALAGMPTLPGTDRPLAADVDPVEVAERLGFPILVKANAGGGGIGMGVINNAAGVAAAVRTARARAERSFGDSSIFFERLLSQPRHVEVQVFGDQQGAVVHMFERDCSVQRRYQKVIEEAPSPAVDSALRKALTDASVRVAVAARYVNAGTVECLLDQQGQFYFLEMNTRLQVEHAITEAITGRDLVQTQLRVASGEPLPWRQSELAATGHAVECRVYAEDPDRHLPSPGRITHYREPSAPHVRVDSGVACGSEVSVHYDPLLAKVITWAESRPAAIARMLDALEAYEIVGVTTNIPLHLRVLRSAPFEAGSYDTNLLQGL
jgi:acetyl/propionyl-CoA carboxylase alpha subunit